MSRNGAMTNRILRRNLSKVQLAGFILSNFIGLAIVIAGIQFYADVRSIWEADDSFINKDYIIINKEVTSSHMLGASSTDFTPAEVDDLSRQPWVRSVGEFSGAGYEVRAYMEQAGRGMSTSMFLEAIPDSFLDVSPADWRFENGDSVVPMIISKDYLTLYNFGFASSSGLPQITEGMLSAIPLRLRLSSRDGSRQGSFDARIVGFSNRLNTILVPEDFMQWSNAYYGTESSRPRRLIIDVSSPGDVAIGEYLEAKGYERAGDATGSEAAYFLKVVSGLAIGVGALITLLSFFILLLSVALLMQKNRKKLHLLIMLGYPLREVGAPFRRITLYVSLASYALAIVAMLIFRNVYIRSIEGLTEGHEVGVAVSLLCGAALVALTLLFNFIAITRKVRSSFY